jgi:hypothetical protein
MGRRRRRRNQTNPVAILVVVGVFVIMAFLKYILIAIGVVAGLAVLFYLIRFIVKIITENKKKKVYESTQYFLDTKIPYKKVRNKEGQWYEINCYEILKQELGNECKILTNTIIPRLDAINEFAEIDLLLFHNTGLYVLELKDYNGYVYGKKDNEKWSVGYSPETNKKIKGTHVYDFYNPIKQNEGHIKDLNKIFPYNYKSYIIFSENMIFNSYISNVTNINNFISVVKSSPVLSQEEIAKVEQIFETLKQYDLSSDENIKNQHIMRQNFNKKKYS